MCECCDAVTACPMVGMRLAQIQLMLVSPYTISPSCCLLTGV